MRTKEVRAQVQNQLAEGVVFCNYRCLDQQWWSWRTKHKLYSAFPLSRLGIEALLPLSCFSPRGPHSWQHLIFICKHAAWLKNHEKVFVKHHNRPCNQPTMLLCVWLGCFGHNLNLAIAKVLKIQSVDSAVRVCRHDIQGISRSWKRKRELKKNQVILNIPEKSLIHHVVMRWGSTFKMIERFLEQQCSGRSRQKLMASNTKR